MSPDGRVYLQWRFARGAADPCSTIGVKPYILSGLP
jgi:hypothetical protein